MGESRRPRKELRGPSWNGGERTLFGAAALLLAALVGMAGPSGLAWGGEPAAPAQPPPEASDRVESRTAHDLEMLRRLLEMTLRSAPAGGSAPAAPASGTENSPSPPRSGTPASAATGADSVPSIEWGGVG